MVAAKAACKIDYVDRSGSHPPLASAASYCFRFASSRSSVITVNILLSVTHQSSVSVARYPLSS